MLFQLQYLFLKLHDIDFAMLFLTLPYYRITGLCPQETTGENVTQEIFVWEATVGNSSSRKTCPYGYNSNDGESGAFRSCRCNDNDCQTPYWLKPDVSNCKYRAYNSEITDALSNLFQVHIIISYRIFK